MSQFADNAANFSEWLELKAASVGCPRFAAYSHVL